MGSDQVFHDFDKLFRKSVLSRPALSQAHANAKANFASLANHDPGPAEKFKHDFQHVQGRTFLGTVHGFGLTSRLLGHRQAFLKIGAFPTRLHPGEICREMGLRMTQNDHTSGHKRAK